MPSDYISFRDTNYFSTLICDYLDKREDLKQFYNRLPNIESFKLQIQEKSKNFNIESTPTFIINNEHKISGALSFKEFETKLLKLVKAKNS